MGETDLFIVRLRLLNRFWLSFIGMWLVVGCSRDRPDGSEGAEGATAGQHGTSTTATSTAGGTGEMNGSDDVSTDTPATSSHDETSEGAQPLQPTADCVHPPVVESCDGEYCRIEPGCFIMGAPPEEFGRALVAEDQVQVTLTRPLWIGRTEVTRAQWQKSGLPVPELVQLNGKHDCVEVDCPQGNATFYDMLRYANRLSELEGLQACYLFEGEGCTGSINTNDFECPQVRINGKTPYECEGYRLPMEAEWEYSARAGSTTAFPNGDITVQRNSGDCLPDSALDAIGWYCVNSLDQVQRVAQKPPNPWGLHDMHGNVLEVVNDLYGPAGYLEGPYGHKAGPLVDPTGVINKPNDLTKIEERPFRVTRGGGHNTPAAIAKSSRRLAAISDDDSASNIGFRVARTIH